MSETIERFNIEVCNCGDGPHLYTEREADGGWVRYTDLAALQAENERLREERDAFKAEADAVRKNLLAESRDLAARADAAEARLALLEDAIRKVKAHGMPMDMGCCFYCASSRAERRHHSGCEWNALIALVVDPPTLQGDGKRENKA